MFGINRKDREKGQGLVEYALILVLVAIVVVIIMALLGPAIGGIFSQVNAALGGEVAFDPSLEQDFGSTQWKNGFDTATPINNYCASEGSGAYYNFYSVDGGGYDYYLASGYPFTGSQYTFMNTGVCP